MKKVIVIYDDKKEKLISLAIDEDYIEDIEYIKNTVGLERLSEIWNLCFMEAKTTKKYLKNVFKEKVQFTKKK